jgi:hypothetical protein
MMAVWLRAIVGQAGVRVDAVRAFIAPPNDIETTLRPGYFGKSSWG